MPFNWLKQPTENLQRPETGRSKAEFTQHQHMYRCTVCDWILPHSAVHNMAPDQHTRSPLQANVNKCEQMLTNVGMNLRKLNVSIC